MPISGLCLNSPLFQSLRPRLRIQAVFRGSTRAVRTGFWRRWVPPAARSKTSSCDGIRSLIYLSLPFFRFAESSCLPRCYYAMHECVGPTNHVTNFRDEPYYPYNSMLREARLRVGLRPYVGNSSNRVEFVRSRIHSGALMLLITRNARE